MVASARVGLDVGSTSVRAAEIARIKGRRTLRAFGRVELPEGSMSGGVVADERAVSAALRHLWTTSSIATRSVSIGVTHRQVVVRELEIANLPLKELRQALPFHVRDVLPFPVEEAVLDFHPLETPEPKAPTVRGLLVAAPKDVVTGLIRAVERANLHVASVDLSCFAALRAAAHLTVDTEALLDIGSNGTNIVIHTDGVPQIVRTIPRGGDEITKLMATRLGLSHTEAEALKYRVGLLGDPDNPEVADVVREAVRPLIGEIRSSFTYFASSHADERVARLALVGGGSQLAGLPELLREVLDVPSVIANPLRRIEDAVQVGRHYELTALRSPAAVSIGLALGAA